MDEDCIEPEILLNAAGKVIRDLVTREMTTRSEHYKDFTEGSAGTMKDPDKVLDAMGSVIDMIENGKTIKQQQDVINQLIENQKERSQLFDNLSLTHEYKRLHKFLKARKCIEDTLLAVAERGELTPGESLALHGILDKSITAMQRRVGIGSLSTNDIEGLINKVDWVAQKNERKLQKDFGNTNPQGREIIRKAATSLNKILKSQSGTIDDD